MSRRSVQAFRLGRELSAEFGVGVELRHEVGDIWLVEWGNGPTEDQMRDRVIAALDRWPEMADRRLRYHRGWTPAAWAVRAIAARRDGSLAREIAARSPAHRRSLERPFAGHSDLTAEDLAVLSYVEQLVDVAPYPDRLSDPADERPVEDLLRAGSRPPTGPNEFRMARVLVNEFCMARVLVNAEQAPKPNPSGPLRVVRGGRCA